MSPGPGLRPQSYPDAATLGITEEQAADFAESAETAWSLWCAEADAAETLHFDDLQYQAVRSMFVTGEFLHLTHWNETPGRTFGLSLQALHPARLRTPSYLQSRTDIRSGVHLGERGQPKGYFIANPPGEHGAVRPDPPPISSTFRARPGIAGAACTASTPGCRKRPAAPASSLLP